MTDLEPGGNVGQAGVGGHGGTGIHADTQDKYGEVLQRVAMHATPTLAPCIHLAQDTSHHQQHSHSHHHHHHHDDDDESADVSFPAAADRSSALRVSVGSESERSPRVGFHGDQPPRDVLLSRINDSAGASPPPPPGGGRVRPVQEAHVTKCVVCVVL